jgi:hypothetical protein
MLLFVDQPRAIKILRTASDSSGKSSRTRIGAINKVTLTKTLGKTIRLSREETDAIENTLEVLKRSKSIKRQAYALEFAEICREVMEYFEGGASRTERELIAVAVLEAARKIRKFEKLST